MKMSAFKHAVKVFGQLGHKVEEAAPKTGLPFDTFAANAGTMYFVGDEFFLEEHPDEITDNLKTFLETARNLTGIEVAKSWLEVEKIRGALLDFFEEYDLLLTPTTTVPAPKIGQQDTNFGKGGLSSFACIFNLSRNPAASVPSGFSSDGLPIGLQIIGRLEDDITVLRASAAFEEAYPWADKYPTVS